MVKNRSTDKNFNFKNNFDKYRFHKLDFFISVRCKNQKMKDAILGLFKLKENDLFLHK